MNIGEKIKHIRKDNKLNQEAFGKIIGISKNAVWNYENNKRVPPLDTLIAISEKFDLPLFEIIDDSECEFNYFDELSDRFKGKKVSDPLSESIHFLSTKPSQYYKQQDWRELNFAYFEPFKYLITNENVEKEFNYSQTEFSRDEIIEIENFLKEMLEFKVNQIKNRKK